MIVEFFLPKDRPGSVAAMVARAVRVRFSMGGFAFVATIPTWAFALGRNAQAAATTFWSTLPAV